MITDDFAGDEITSEPVRWSTGQTPAVADAVLWAIGRVRPNTDWLPPELLDEGGFVRVTRQLQLPGHPEVFAVGDVAATDPLRSSARNRGDGLVARNIRAVFDDRPLRSFKAPGRRWGRWSESSATGWRCSSRPGTPSGSRCGRSSTW